MEINIGKIIKKYRKHEGITQESLAERLDISVRYLMFIENEGKYPSFTLLYKIINELSIDPNELFYPNKKSSNIKLNTLYNTLSNCDSNTLDIISDIIEVILKAKY